MEIITNRHECVDLGLPSGTLWAKTNVGAMKETETGFYFAWGDTEQHHFGALPNYGFTRTDYKYGAFTFRRVNHGMTKYNKIDKISELKATDDAVKVKWGGDWSMPTKAQCEELINTPYIINAWATNYHGSGVNGILFINENNGKHLFIPAVGYCENQTRYYAGGRGCIWTSSLDTDNVGCAWNLNFGCGILRLGDLAYRYIGMPVRGVISK